MARRRYQRGYLYLRGKKTSMWVGRWREDVMRSDGSVKRIRRSLVIGTRGDFPTRRLAERQFETLLARINAPSYRPGRIASLAEFADRWRSEVLIHHKPSSIKAANSHLRCHILPLLQDRHKRNGNFVGDVVHGEELGIHLRTSGIRQAYDAYAGSEGTRSLLYSGGS